MEAKPRNLYLVLPAQVTGDLWHCAAASILSRKYLETPKPYHLVIVIVICRAAIYNFNDDGTRPAVWDSILGRVNGTNILSKKHETAFKEWGNQVVAGRATWNFLRNTGADIMTVVVDDVYSESASVQPGSRSLEFYVHSNLKDEKLDELYNSYKQSVQDGLKLQYPGWDEVRAYLREIDLYKQGLKPSQNADLSKAPFGYADAQKLFLRPNHELPASRRTEQNPFSRLLRYYAATTIACQLMTSTTDGTKQIKLEANAKTERMKFLRDRLSSYDEGVWKELKPLKPMKPGIVLTEDEIEKLANEKIAILIQFFSQYDNDKKTGPVYLYNHRINNVNSSTNSKDYVISSLYREIQSANSISGSKARFVMINAADKAMEKYEMKLKDKDSAEEVDCVIPVFDLFNKVLGGKWQYPGIDPMVTSRFWKKIAEKDAKFPALTSVFGLFSGRTGSFDIAAFNGVNAVFWDQPWIMNAQTDVTALQYLELLGGGNSTFPQQLRGSPVADMRQLSKSRVQDVQRIAQWISVNEDQVSQCLRCLQLAAFCVVTIPHLTGNENFLTEVARRWIKPNKDNASHGMLTCENFMSDEHNFDDLRKKTFEKLDANNWMFFQAPNKPYPLAYYRGQIEAYLDVNGKDGYKVRCTLLDGMGFVDEQKCASVVLTPTDRPTKASSPQPDNDSGYTSDASNTSTAVGVQNTIFKDWQADFPPLGAKPAAKPTLGSRGK